MAKLPDPAEKLLAEIVRQNPPVQGPRRIDFFPAPPGMIVVAIGKDHTATILIHAEDLAQLKERNP